MPARRGWVDALGLYAVAFGAYAITSIGACIRILGGPDLPWMTYGWNPNAISVAAGCLWIAVIIYRHLEATRWHDVIVGLAVGMAAAACANVHSAAWPAELWDVLAAIVCVSLCLLLAHRRGVDLSGLGIAPRWAANKIGQQQVLEVALISTAGQFATDFASSLIMAGLPWLPEGVSKQVEIHGLVLAVHLTASSIIQETVLVAGVVTALEAARRPAWQIYGLYLAMYVSFHLYYGTQALTMMIFAAVNLWLFRRTRRLTPLIIVHIAYDAYAAFGGRSAGITFVPIGLCSVIFLLGAIVFIALKSTGRQIDATADDPAKQNCVTADQ